jgi:hypothetical protein
MSELEKGDKVPLRVQSNLQAMRMSNLEKLAQAKSMEE